MKRAILTLAIIAAICSASLVSACRSTPPPRYTAPSPQRPQVEPKKLYDQIIEGDYGSWEPAPGYKERQKARGPHGDQVQIFLDPIAEAALAAGESSWPVDAVIVKDIWRDGRLVQIAAMRKTADGWYWGEWDPEGEPSVEGLKAEPCNSCHARGSDGTLAVELE